jgi:hypothetical protein
VFSSDATGVKSAGIPNRQVRDSVFLSRPWFAPQLDLQPRGHDILTRVEVGMELVHSEQHHRTTIRHGEIYDQ